MPEGVQRETAFAEYKARTMRAAKDLGYPRETADKLDAAKSIFEVNHIMETERRKWIQAEDDEKERALSKAYFEKRYHRKGIHK